MSIYKKVTRKNDIGYTKDTVFTNKDRVPQWVKERLEYAPEVEVDEVTKPCLFCDDQANHKRMVNLVMVDLCEYHYFNTNIGKIAEQLRKGVSHGTQAKETRISEGEIKPKVAESKNGRQHAEKRRLPSWGERIEIE